MTTTNHSFTSSGLTSIMALGSLAKLLNKRHLVLSHLHYSVSGISTYKSERYSVGHVLGMIRDDKREQESDDKDLKR